MPWHNLRHSRLPSIWERPTPRRRLSRNERVQFRARVLRARVHTHYHPRRMRILGRLRPLFRQAEKRERARACISRQVRAQRKKLPLSMWQAAIGHALNESEHPGDHSPVAIPTVLEEGQSDEDTDDDYDAVDKLAPSSDESSSDEDLGEKEVADEVGRKKERRSKDTTQRIERRVGREAARERRIEHQVLRTPPRTRLGGPEPFGEYEAKSGTVSKRMQNTLAALRRFKEQQAAKRISPTVEKPTPRRIQPSLVQSIELPSEDSADENFNPDNADSRDRHEGEALIARIGPRAGSEDSSESASAAEGMDAEKDDDEAMDEDNADDDDDEAMDDSNDPDGASDDDEEMQDAGNEGLNMSLETAATYETVQTV